MGLTAEIKCGNDIYGQVMDRGRSECVNNIEANLTIQILNWQARGFVSLSLPGSR